ncbi:transcription initiation factor TFIID component TAF4 [Podospora conica]|nr:transcription initiation factor TFIID component TAF4 [Schizothecium conicum]
MPSQTQTRVHSPAVPSPSHANSPTLHAAQYGGPYGNGASTPTMAMPTSNITMPTSTATTPLATPSLMYPSLQPGSASSPSTPGPAMPQSQQQYTNAQMVPFGAPPQQQQQQQQPSHGAMGPPSKPAERPTKEYEYDVSDSLAGTGIDLRAEEQYLTDYYAGSFSQEARTGLPSNAPGGKQSMYGAGFANQPAQSVDAETQDQYAAAAARNAWDESAQRLAVLHHSNEMHDPFLLKDVILRKAGKISEKIGVTLNTDVKNAGSTGKKHQDAQIKVSTTVGPDGAMVVTSGSSYPHDGYLADQLALLSLACKHRVRELLEDAFRVAAVRQTTSNGEIPDEWADAAVPVQPGLEDLDMTESILAPTVNPLKRTHDAANPVAKQNTVTKTLRDMGEGERKVEDSRLKKRQKRTNPDTATAGSRAGSVAPGTPGADSEAKAPSKKELKKGAALAKAAEAASTASANQTLSTMMGGFGGRKKGKQYSWMKGSGANSPRIGTPGTPGASLPGSGGGIKAPVEARLTQEPKTRWGTWRENIQGKNIQMRDWVTVLEMDGKDQPALQVAYSKLDATGK